MEKEKIRPLYSELQGYLAQAPEPKSTTDTIFSEHVWSQYNECINLLQKITEKDYKRFLIQPEPDSNSALVRVITYRQKLGGLIASLHGEYFSDEPAHFTGSPHTVITQSQQQNQSVLIQMIFDFQDKIEQCIGKYQDGSKEKTFLQKLKGTIRNITDFTQMISAISQLAKNSGISVDDLSKIFS